jgi:hypothetical protein
MLDDRYNLAVTRLAEALLSEDELGMVVRAHIHLENQLQEFILVAAANPHEVKFSEIDFAGTVRLALALGLDPKLKAALNAAGSLRNKFSHRLEMKLGEEEARNLFTTLTPNDANAVQNVYMQLRKNTEESSGEEKVRRLRQASARERVQVFFISIFSRLISERHRLENNSLSNTDAGAD